MIGLKNRVGSKDNEINQYINKKNRELYFGCNGSFTLFISKNAQDQIGLPSERFSVVESSCAIQLIDGSDDTSIGCNEIVRLAMQNGHF